MVGGFISLSGKKNISLNDRLKFLLFEYKLKYNAYIIRKNRKAIINIDIFIADEQRLILILTEDLAIIEKRIKNTLYTDEIQFTYRTK